MKNKKLIELNIDNELFKKLKKHKKVIYLQPNDENLKSLEDKSKVIIINNKTNKKITRKVNKVHRAQNIEELKKNLKKKGKYIYSIDIEQDKEIIGIEFKYKRKIIRKMCLGLFILLILFVLYFFISNVIKDYKVNKLKDDIENINEEITYAIVEINPKVILEIKNGKVIKKGCLNEDCKVIFNDVNITDKTLKEVTEILYNKAKDNGIDVSNGVLISSTNKEIENEVKDLNYVTYKEINIDEEKQYINKVLDNNEIKEQTSKEEINNKLLEIYKKDSDYGKYYTCNIKNAELKCYITKELENILSKEADTLTEFYEVLNNARKFEKILEKFNIKYGSGGIEGLNQSIIENIYINDINYDLFGGTCHAVSTISATGVASETKETCYNTFSITIEQNDELESYRQVLLPISRFNLVSSDYNETDLVVLTNDEEGNLVITNG